MSEEVQQPDSVKTKQSLLPAVVEAKISLDLTKDEGNYQQVLKEGIEYEVTEDNFENAQGFLKKIIKFLNYVEGHRKDEKEWYLEGGRIVDAAHKKFLTPFEEVKKKLQEKINIVGKRMENEAKKAKDEKDRIQSLIDSINTFILDSSTKIAAATTNEQFLSIERLINLEKGNKSRYQDHLPLLIERSNELTAKIKEQKGLIKTLDKVEEEKNKALLDGNDEKAQELLQKSENLEAKIEENAILVQENATKSVIFTNIVAPEVEMPSTRRKAWKFEVHDIKETMKKRPDLLDVTLNNKAVSEVLKTLKDTGVLIGRTEYVLNGIRFFQDINY